MSAIKPFELPQEALLRRYQQGEAYADCYVTEVPGTHSHAAFVEAFYTTALFKLERIILRLAARPSTDEQARQLALGSADSFAAWKVEARNADQLLLGDFTGRTKSWLMVEPAAGNTCTRLYFGSAVLSRPRAGSRERGMGFIFHALLGFHKLYSRLLLASARSRLLARSAT